MSEPIRLLAIGGSLRAVSSSGALLQAAALVAPPGVTVEAAPSVGGPPHFNPDLDGAGAEPPAAVAEFRARIREADGVLICTPEYVHGVPGSLKNALDWVASSGDLIGKPVALVNPSATSTHGHESLVETLRVLMAEVIPARIPLRSNRVDAAGLLRDADAARALADVVGKLRAAILAGRSPAS